MLQQSLNSLEYHLYGLAIPKLIRMSYTIVSKYKHMQPVILNALARLRWSSLVGEPIKSITVKFIYMKLDELNEGKKNPLLRRQ